MFRRHNMTRYLKLAIIPAILYLIFAVLFLWKSAFQMTYILYIGNMLFGFSIAVFIWLFSKRESENVKTGKLIFAGHITAVMAILIICVIDILLLYVIPSHATGMTQATSPQLQQSPPQLGHMDKGLILVLFMSTIVGNISTGSFISIIFPYMVKRDQKGDLDLVKS